MDYSTLAFYLILANLLHGGFLTAFSIRDLIRKREAYDQKFNGLTYLIKGVALILISLFLYDQLASGLGAAYIVCAMILAPLLPYYKAIWDSRTRIFRAIFQSRADILVQLSNNRWEQLEARKLEYTSTLVDKEPGYLHSDKS